MASNSRIFIFYPRSPFVYIYYLPSTIYYLISTIRFVAENSPAVNR